MATAYDSDSSAGDDVETGVTLGYASEERTPDDFSRLGGHPAWLDATAPPSGSLAKCKSCNGLLSLLLQLNGDLPDRFPGHERRLYLFICRRKACRRKEGSVRGLRSTRIDSSAAKPATKPTVRSSAGNQAPQPTISNLGDTLFGSKTSNPSATGTNPFGSTKSASGSIHPFAPKSEAGQAQSTPMTETLSQTFAEKAQIGAQSSPAPMKKTASEPWPEQTAFPPPYPSYYIDADKEFLEPEPAAASRTTQIVETEADSEAGGSGGAVDVKDAFESSMDKTFQRFADRMSQNPEQVLRYEFGAQPLLYSKTDAVGRAWPRVPRCSTCGGERTFELQLTPHAITELEADDISLDGMDWGTIILAVCTKDCEGSNEEWVGVQWEELASKKQA